MDQAMRGIGSLVAVGAVIAPTWAWAQVPSHAEPSREAQRRTPPRVDAEVVAAFRYEPTRLWFLRPYCRGWIRVVLIHGLWSNPWSWARMIKEMEADATLRARYHFWTFGCSIGDPLAYSATLLRRDLDEVQRNVDPERSDAAFSRMVVVGHSMGGLLAKTMVQESGTRLWRLVFIVDDNLIGNEKAIFDSDDAGIFHRQVEFIQQARLPFGRLRGVKLGFLFSTVISRDDVTH